jgi:molybdate transport system substrate-binding protein
VRSRSSLALILAALLLSACGNDNIEPGSSRGTKLLVFAAASLTEAFQEIGAAFEERNSGVSLDFNFLASSDLAAQIQQGAPADVFASADEPNMQIVVDEGLASGAPQVFAHNKLVIVVPAGNPGSVGSLEDLENPDLVVSVCVEECPAGRYARAIFENAGIDVEPDSLEPEVKAVVTRVETGEADAGVVYATDVLVAGDDVMAIPIADEVNVLPTYSIVALQGSPAAGGELVDFVLSEGGQEILQDHGFLPR